MLATLGFARSVLIVVCLSTAALVGVIGAVNLQADAKGTRARGVTARPGTAAKAGQTLARAEIVPTMHDIERSMAAMRYRRDRVVGFGPTWGLLATLGLVGMLALHAHRSGKRRMEEAFRRIFEREFERLKRLKDDGEWPILPPTAEMERVSAQLAVARRSLASLSDGGVPLRAEDAGLCTVLGEKVVMLEQYLEALDIRRRMDVSLESDDVALPPARTLSEKVQSLLISQGLLASLSTTSRVIHTAGLVLLVPSLMGVCSVSIRNAVDRRVADLDQVRASLSRLEVRLSVDQAREDWERAKAGLTEDPVELSEEEDSALKRIAARFEQQVTDPPNWGTPARGASSYAYRAAAVRNQVLSRASRWPESPWRRMPSMSESPNFTPAERGVSGLRTERLRRRPDDACGTESLL